MALARWDPWNTRLTIGGFFNAKLNWGILRPPEPQTLACSWLDWLGQLSTLCWHYTQPLHLDILEVYAVRI